MTGEIAPGLPGSADGTQGNGADCQAFFGSVTAADFNVSDGAVQYTGAPEWSYSRYILHSAAVCAAAGGVDAFCIGTEMRGMTQMRDADGYPAVARLVALAAEVRQLLPDAELTYAADWSEYFGHQPQDGSGDVVFHLDPLWSDDNIDFIGIDNYMPLSDWRDGAEHADAEWPAIHDLGYLKANIEGGEGWDWFYPSDAAREAQAAGADHRRTGRHAMDLPLQGVAGLVVEPPYRPDRSGPSFRSVGRGEPCGMATAAGRFWSARLRKMVGVYGAPVSVAGGADPWQAIETGTAFPAEADRDHELRLTLKGWHLWRFPRTGPCRWGPGRRGDRGLRYPRRPSSRPFSEPAPTEW